MDFLQGKDELGPKLTLDIIGLRRIMPPPGVEIERLMMGKREGELIAPLSDGACTLHPGEEIQVDVVIRNRRVGHRFPGGPIDLFDIWLEFQVVDDEGRIIYHIGKLTEEGMVDANDLNIRFYRGVFLDRLGNRIDKHNFWDEVKALYKMVISPGTADVAHYRFKLPEDVGKNITITSRLHHVRFNWWYNKWVFAGQPVPDSGEVNQYVDNRQWQFDPTMPVPELPITTMAEAWVTLPVLSQSSPSAGETTNRLLAFLQKAEGVKIPVFTRADRELIGRPTVPLRERWNDYGIGLLLRQEYPEAVEAFTQVIALDPDYADGYINRARVWIKQELYSKAEEELRKVLERWPDAYKAHFFLGLALQRTGRYEEALRHLSNVAKQFPNDPVVQQEIGRTAFLKKDFPLVVRAFQEALVINPEDVIAHFYLWQAYQELGQKELGERAERIYRYMNDKPFLYPLSRFASQTE